MKYNPKIILALLASASLMVSCGTTAPPSNAVKAQSFEDTAGSILPGPLPPGVLLRGGYPFGSYLGTYSAGSGGSTVKLDVAMNWQSAGFGLVPWDFPAAYMTVCGYDQNGTNLFCKTSPTVFGYSGGGSNNVTCTAPTNLASVVVYGADAISHPNDRAIYGRVGYFFADRGLQPGPFAPPC
jgi:hypothetical protein